LDLLVDFYGIQWGGTVIADDFNAIIFNSVALNHCKMAAVQTSEVDAKTYTSQHYIL
jgi:hypothetical protein